jgi:hypothetical protein
MCAGLNTMLCPKGWAQTFFVDPRPLAFAAPTQEMPFGHLQASQSLAFVFPPQLVQWLRNASPAAARALLKRFFTMG